MTERKEYKNNLLQKKKKPMFKHPKVFENIWEKGNNTSKAKIGSMPIEI